MILADVAQYVVASAHKMSQIAGYRESISKTQLLELGLFEEANQ